MNLVEWNQLCQTAWENDYEFLQIDRSAKIGGGRYTISNCNKTTHKEFTFRSETFFIHINVVFI